MQQGTAVGAGEQEHYLYGLVSNTVGYLCLWCAGCGCSFRLASVICMSVA